MDQLTNRDDSNDNPKEKCALIIINGEDDGHVVDLNDDPEGGDRGVVLDAGDCQAGLEGGDLDRG